MNIELKMLIWTAVLGLVQIAVGASFSTLQRGMKWNTGPRDTPAPELTGVGARLDRALKNLLETFPFFAAAALTVVATRRGDAGTALGAQLYFGARVAYVGIYAAGIPFLRTIVWTVSVAGIAMVLKPLLMG